MSEVISLRNGQQSFRPSARLISILGEYLISSAAVGISELVKNSYDADADHVTVKLLNLSSPKDTVVIVEDNDNGMDLDTVLYKWLEPATGHKEEAKKKDERSKKGRLPLGEKGVGRFAAHKLGHHLTLISRSRDSAGRLSDTEVIVTIHWDDFDDPDKYLSDIGVTYAERYPEHFTTGSGTYMEMQHARALWAKKDVNRVAQTLLRLMSPFRTPEAFTVSFVCPDYPQTENLDPGELLNTAHARLTVLVDETGIADYEYEFKLSPYPLRVVEPQKIDLRKNIPTWQSVTRSPLCGTFFVTLYIWDRGQNSLKLSGTNRDQLNQFAGISVFRDGIRVMPYGEPEDDWLGIDELRLLRTSEVFERRNVVGAVEINQETNKELRDKSNREGFIENDAYTDLRALMLAVMNIAFNEFAADREKIRKKEKADKKELIPAVTHLENSINTITKAVEETRQMADSFVQQGKITPEVAWQFTANLNQTRQTIANAVNETKEAAAETLRSFDEEREMLLALAGLGLAAERFTHEFARLTPEASDLVQDIEKSPDIQRLKSIKTNVETLSITLEALRDLVLALGPMFYIRRKTNEQAIDVKTIVGHALLLNQGQIQEHKIQVEVIEPEGKLSVIMRRGALTQAFNNLIDNACYWLSRKSEENDRRLKITILAEERAVVVADNGFGVNPRERQRIFDIFFSTKTDGRGLGLFITREALAEAKSTIELLEPGEHFAAFRVGAAFKIQFS